MTVSADYYDLLLVARDAAPEDIKKAFRRAALKHHPDKGGDEEMFKEINAAWETLGDEDKRKTYDRTIYRSGSTVTTRSNSKENPPPPDRSKTFDAKTFDATSRARSTSKTNPPPPTRHPSPVRKQASVVIPDDLNALTVKDLKELMTSMNMRHDDCIEKKELIARINSRKRPNDNGRGKENTSSNVPNTFFPNNSVRIKVITMGAAGVGKSCLVKRYCEGRFVNRYITTIGVDYGVKSVPNIHKHSCKVNFFDLSGQPEFSEIRIEFYRDAQGVLLCYDCTQKQTFKDLTQWMFESRMHGLDLEKDRVIAVLCATKCDQNGRQVSRSEGAAFAQEKGMLFFETSAQSGENVNDALNAVFERVVATQLEARSKMGL